MSKSIATLGTLSTLSIGIGGMVGGGIFATTGLAVELTKGAAPIAFIISGIVALLNAFAEPYVLKSENTLNLIKMGVLVFFNYEGFELIANATRYQFWILIGMVALSFAIEIIYRRISGRTIRLGGTKTTHQSTCLADSLK